MGKQNLIAGKLPGVRLHLAGVVACPGRDAGELIGCMKRDIARGLADEIVNRRPFFEATERPGGLLIDVKAACVVLTEDELRAALVEQFEAGLKQAWTPAHAPYDLAIFQP